MSIENNVNKYFEKNNMQYKVIDVFEKQNDKDIYIVLAKHTNYPEIKRQYGGGEYTVWTCWNEYTESLNFGHYDLDLKTAVNVVEKYR